MSDFSALACSLEGRTFQERVRWIAGLNRRFLRCISRTGLTLTLVYAAEAREDVLELVRQERECCAALDFSVREAGNQIELRITVPSHAFDQADVLLHPFHGEGAIIAKSCCGECAEPVLPAVKSTSAANSAIGASAVAIVACGACCVLPVAFPVIAAGTMGVAVTVAAAAHVWLTGLAALTLMGAWWRVWRQSKRRGARPATSTLVQMGVASLLMTVAIVWPWIEPLLIVALLH